ncbi:hypothetical protein [Pedobacter cryoconitis]|uniref:Uncharacterized protein n=1 Tax=Pedobacter cryoconitis TaxID=188932 RepID=A0A7X0MH25_9SPHI|nr:hypothetical protein [Pedobacter cryoconitis]MBB6498694.1 hypothetical protein [Pedobacter cryoconitis]
MQKYTYITEVNKLKTTLTINPPTAIVPLYQVFTHGKLVGCLVKEVNEDNHLSWSGTTRITQDLAIEIGDFIYRIDLCCKGLYLH